MQIHHPSQSLTACASAIACSVNKSAEVPSDYSLEVSSAHLLNPAVAADASLKRCGGQTMQSLALPRPISSFSAPLGLPSEHEDGLAKFRSKFSPSRSEQQGYPSPPMSEPHSPTRRHPQTSDPSRTSYSSLGGSSHGLVRGLPLPPPSSALFESRSYQTSGQRPLYSDEAHSRVQPFYSHSSRNADQPPYASLQVSPEHPYGYPSSAVPQYGGAHHAGPPVQQAAMIAPPPARPTKPARRTKAHVASACVNCKKAHLSCDVQRPCGRCVSSGKQVSHSVPHSSLKTTRGVSTELTYRYHY